MQDLITGCNAILCISSMSFCTSAFADLILRIGAKLKDSLMLNALDMLAGDTRIDLMDLCYLFFRKINGVGNGCDGLVNIGDHATDHSFGIYFSETQYFNFVYKILPADYDTYFGGTDIHSGYMISGLFWCCESIDWLYFGYSRILNLVCIANADPWSLTLRLSTL